MVTLSDKPKGIKSIKTSQGYICFDCEDDITRYKAIVSTMTGISKRRLIPSYKHFELIKEIKE